MSNKNESVFYIPSGLYNVGSDGLTKRELFAGMALMGILANSNGIGVKISWPKGASSFAVESADSLLAELEKQN